MGKPDIPEPPDPRETAAASTGTNVSTAIANAMLGNVNQYTPDGSLTFDQTGTYQMFDPYTGQTYDVPRFSATQALTPQGQQLLDANNKAKLNMANLAADQSGRLQELLGTPFDLSGAPQAGKAGQYSKFNNGPRLQTEFGDAGDITKTYGIDFSEDRQRVEDAMFSRLEKSLGKDFGSLEQRLANQGIRAGSNAYSRAMQDYGQNVQDARTSAILGAGQEQSRLSDLEARRAAFQNQAQNQNYGQLLGRANFGNAGQQQMYQNYFNANQGNNALASQTFQEQNALRNQYIQEQFAQRNQPINEITALMSGTQVSNPQFVNAQMPTIPTTDTGGIINNHYAQQVAKAQAEYQAQSGLFGGIMGGLGSLFSLSDERMKKDISRVGKTEDGQNIYTYRYKGEGPEMPVRLGLMAQEVEKKHPEAVREFGGVKHVNYGAALGV